MHRALIRLDLGKKGSHIVQRELILAETLKRYPAKEQKPLPFAVFYKTENDFCLIIQRLLQIFRRKRISPALYFDIDHAARKGKIVDDGIFHSAQIQHERHDKTDDTCARSDQPQRRNRYRIDNKRHGQSQKHNTCEHKKFFDFLDKSEYIRLHILPSRTYAQRYNSVKNAYSFSLFFLDA